MCPSISVQELEIDPERFAVSGQAHREFLLHLVEKQRFVTLFSGGNPYSLAGTRRNKHLGLKPGSGDLSRFGNLGWEDSRLR